MIRLPGNIGRRRRLRRPRTGGFALILTVSLLALLTLLVTGLAASLRVNRVTATATQRTAQARQNALFAQSLALAQLQRWAGPDQRVTASAAWTNDAIHPHWTGVWDTTHAHPGAATWLVSGNEHDPIAVQPNSVIAETDLVQLYRSSSAATSGVVSAPRRAITADDPLRDAGSVPTTVGHYAWWVGDQGLKAPVAVPGPAVFDADWRPDLFTGAAPLSDTGAILFDPRAVANAGLIDQQRIIVPQQLGYLRQPSGARLGPDVMRDHSHAWTHNNLGVLANTIAGGLRQDLSTQPGLLGSAFAAWCNSAGYMEAPSAPDSAYPIVPGYGSRPFRHRHRIRPTVSDDGITFTNAPVIGSFFLQFNVRRTGGNAAPAAANTMEVRARLVVQLWNPWTSAIVPEPLRLAIEGLPDLVLLDSNGGRQPVSLQDLFGRPMVVELSPEETSFSGDPDDRSWLPGRVYAWRTRGGRVGAWQTEFYNRTLSVPNANLWVSPTGLSYLAPAGNGVLLSVSGASSQLTVTLQLADGRPLATVRSPEFAAFSTTPQRASNNDEYRFGFPFRLLDPIDLVAAPDEPGWLSLENGDPRGPVSGEPVYRAGSGGDLPSAYVGVGGNAILTNENRLLDRVMGRSGMSYNEDVPVFELPRAPLRSIGELQHLPLAGRRPFCIGNSWAGPTTLNGVRVTQLFDRFFFSGLRDNATHEGSGFSPGLPGSLLEIVPRHSVTGAPVARSDFTAATGGYLSTFLLQGGAFNLNSVNAAAWLAVLRGSRLRTGESFEYHNVAPENGTAADDAIARQPGHDEAAYFRFPQSARETFKADPGYAASTTAPPLDPSMPSTARTDLYRRGVRLLDPAQTGALATALASAIRTHHGESGPFRSVEDFLAPRSRSGGGNVLEQAIANAGLNADIGEFSSQWLTSADLMTTLGPVLFARSDTFVIRSYGDAVNPATDEIEGRTWCEALVQRQPWYVDPVADSPATPPAQLTSDLNRSHGRRFRVVAFRWLNRDEL